MSKIKIAFGLYSLFLTAATPGPVAGQEVQAVTGAPRKTVEAKQICNHHDGWGAECLVRSDVSLAAARPTTAHQVDASHTHERRNGETTSPKR